MIIKFKFYHIVFIILVNLNVLLGQIINWKYWWWSIPGRWYWLLKYIRNIGV